MRAARQRADVLLTERGLTESRARAQALILAGKVFCGERRVEKAGDMLPGDAALQVRGQDHPWVSRGGLKLDHALSAFTLSPAGLVCLDIGASTGGFTDVLLHHGAARVHAIDVGHGQLAWNLRTDPRVIVHERTNARHLQSGPIGGGGRRAGVRRKLHRPAHRAARRSAAMRTGRLGGGADQAAIRGRTRSGRRPRRGARPRGSPRRVRHDQGVVGFAPGVARSGDHRQPHHRPGRQQRVPDRSPARVAESTIASV